MNCKELYLNKLPIKKMAATKKVTAIFILG